jgi:signal transduction histidine kinase
MDFVGEEDVAEVGKLITDHKEKRTCSYSFKARWKHKDESLPLYLESKVTRLSSYDDGTGQPAENAITRNFVITDEVLAKKERNTLSEMKGEFIAIASHQLRTPLASLNLDLDILDLEMADEGIAGSPSSLKETIAIRLQKVRNSVDRMTNLTGDLLIYGKAQNGKLLPSLASHDLMQVLTRQLNSSFNSYTDFRLEFPTNEKLMVRIDPIFLGHIIDNVVGNAIKYHPHKRLPQLIIRKQPEHVLLEIKDNGIGIPKNEIEKVQESFARGSNVNGVPGTGLGLAIVKIFCELCTIKLSIKSVQNEGTTVALEIPKS